MHLPGYAVIYVDDPNGNVVEFYVDRSDRWKQDPQFVANAILLEL